MHIGVDMGGTKLEAVALDGAGRELMRRRESTPQGDYQATVRAIAGLVQGLEGEAGERGSVGVGFPGTISPLTGLDKNSNALWVNGEPFGRECGTPIRRAKHGDSSGVRGAAWLWPGDRKGETAWR